MNNLKNRLVIMNKYTQIQQGLKLTLSILCVLLSCQHTAFGQDLKVGLSQMNITAPVGYPHYRGISTGVHDPLYAKVMYLTQGEEEVAVVSCDLLWISRALSTEARSKIAQQSTIPYENIVIGGTHSHTSPAYEPDILELNEHIRKPISANPKIKGEDYEVWLVDQIVKAVLDAKEKSLACSVATGQGMRDDLSFNRRYIMADGKVKTNPGVLNPAAIRVAGPIDPEVSFLFFKDKSDRPLGAFVNFANHTDTKGGTEFSADFPGFLAESLQSTYGSQFLSIYGQGTCGNLNHVNIHQKTRLTSQQIGEGLADEVRKQVPAMIPLSRPQLRMDSKIVYAPLQHYTEEELAQAKTDVPFYDESPFFQLRRSMKIRSLERIRQKEAIPPTVLSGSWTLPLEVQVIKINEDLAFVGLPGEVFVELGLAIKKASPFKQTMIMELTNAHIAYVPTVEGFKRGGYETINSRLAPGGGELMVKAAIQLLQDLKK